MLILPELEKSYWRNDYAGQSIYPEPSQDLRVDVAIVGAGITGLSAAYLLKQSGFKVAVLEKKTVGSGTTGRTTGKVTSQHSLIYSELAKRHDRQTAKLYGQANQAAITQIESIINKETINCGWSRQDNYVFTANSKLMVSFKKEAELAAKLGLPSTYETNSPLPFEVKAAVKFANQAKLNSQKYLLGLASAINGNGSQIFENSNVINIKDGQPGTVKTNRAEIKAKHIIVATNVPTLPLIARGSYCALEYPRESYLIAGKLDRNFDGMYISPDKNHYSILPVINNGSQMLLIGGEGHLSGMRIGTASKYQRLADYAEQNFGITEVTNRWSDRDYLSYDSLPLIGKLYPWSKNTYVATAFRKWGLSNGTVSAMILHDLIIGKPNPWVKTFDSNRLKPIISFPRAVLNEILGKA